MSAEAQAFSATRAVMRKMRIGVLAYDGVTAVNLVGPVECFSLATKLAVATAQPFRYEVVILSFAGLRFTTDSGLNFSADFAADDAPLLDTIIIPGGEGLRQGKAAGEIATWIKSNVDDVRRVATICSGIYALAPTGLLDGRRATTHWQLAGDVATRFPLLRMSARELVVRDGKFYSSGGATAGIDLALRLIEEDCGDDVALSVARTMLVYRRRDGDQEQYADPAAGEPTREKRFGELGDWIQRNLHGRLSLPDLARQAGVTPGKINSDFKARLGTTPSAFVKQLRLEESRRKLARGDSVEAVAKGIRFGSKYYFEREFRWRFGIHPEDYRARFAPLTSRDDQRE